MVRPDGTAFIYSAARLTSANIKNAVEAHPPYRLERQQRGWHVGEPDAESFVYALDDEHVQKHNERREIRRQLGKTRMLPARIRTVLSVYHGEETPDPPVADLTAPLQVLPDRTAINYAERIAHSLKSWATLSFMTTIMGSSSCDSGRQTDRRFTAFVAGRLGEVRSRCASYQAVIRKIAELPACSYILLLWTVTVAAAISRPSPSPTAPSRKIAVVSSPSGLLTGGPEPQRTSPLGGRT